MCSIIPSSRQSIVLSLCSTESVQPYNSSSYTVECAGWTEDSYSCSYLLQDTVQQEPMSKEEQKESQRQMNIDIILLLQSILFLMLYDLYLYVLSIRVVVNIYRNISK